MNMNRLSVFRPEQTIGNADVIQSWDGDVFGLMSDRIPYREAEISVFPRRSETRCGTARLPYRGSASSYHHCRRDPRLDDGEISGYMKGGRGHLSNRLAKSKGMHFDFAYSVAYELDGKYGQD